MQKNDWYKLIAVGFVAIFAIEMVALGAFNSNNSGTGSTNGNTPANTTGINMLGTVSTNLTIGPYPPYIIVKGSGADADAIKQSLIDRGIATYAVPSGDSLIINLTSTGQAVMAAAEFTHANITATTQIDYIMPQSVQVVGTDISTVTGERLIVFTLDKAPEWDW